MIDEAIYKMRNKMRKKSNVKYISILER